MAQVKNRMDPSFDSCLSAGYRDVVVNLRLVCAAAAGLGIDLHVCEVATPCSLLHFGHAQRHSSIIFFALWPL